MKNIGDGTLLYEDKPSVLSFAAVVGKKEGDGPYGKYFDMVESDEYNGEKSWEKAECGFMKQSTGLALKKGGFEKSDMDFVIAGDLLNQCTSSGYAVRELHIPFFGVYGACSTIAESILLGSALVSGGGATHILCATASHYCSAEKQYRTPLEYGGQRTPTAQWTVTGSGAAVIGKNSVPPYIDVVTVGRIIDMGIKDANNMGGAMAPAFADTLVRHLNATGRTADYYDLILSGDLGITGKSIAREILKREGIILGDNYNDCGAMIFDADTQDTHSGGSGCGCAASMLCGYILPKMRKGELKRVLLCATGALLSPTTTMQGESIPSISHAVSFEA